MKNKCIVLCTLLMLCYSVAHAEFAAVDKIVYWLNDEYSTAVVENFLNTSGSITIPPYVTYRGVKYKVIAITKNDFNTSTRNTYNVSSTIFGNGFLTNLATLDAAAREKEERPFRYDYAPIRATIKTLNLPNTLLSIEKGAFDGMKSLRSLVIPASVVYVPDKSSKIFNDYLPNLQSITILGLPTYEYYDWDKGTINVTITSQDDDGNFIYPDLIKSKFGLSYCRNLKTFSMPEFEKKRPLIDTFYQLNTKLEKEAEQYSADISKISSNSDIQLPFTALKDEACVDQPTLQEAYNQAHQYLENMYQSCKNYVLLRDSLTDLLKENAYYDGSILPLKIPSLDLEEPQVEQIAPLAAENREELLNEYNELIGGKMERNLEINQPRLYIDGYMKLHTEERSKIEELYQTEYRCENEKTKNKNIIKFIKTRELVTTCRQKQWMSNKSLFDSKEDFDAAYNTASDNANFEAELNNREQANSRLKEMKVYVTAHLKDINLSNVNKKPNAYTEQVMQYLTELKKSYYYDKGVSFLIQTMPKVQKEYEKNGQYFNSEIEFFEAYSSNSYSQTLKENKKK